MHNLVSILIVVAAISVVLGTGTVLWFYARQQTKGSRRTLKLELRNDGNVPGRYELQAEEPSGSLRFQWWLNGSPLVLRQLPQGVNVPQLPAAPASPLRPTSSASLQLPADARRNASGAFADGLMSIGYVLPWSIGRPLINLGSQLRFDQPTARQVSKPPSVVTRMGPMATTEPAYAVGSGQPAFAPISAPSAGGSVPAAPSLVAAGAWAQTPAVPPGGTVVLDLRIELARAQRIRQYKFRVTSKSLDEPDLQVTENGSVSIGDDASFQRLVPLLIFAAVALLTFACTSFLLSSLRIVGG